MNYTINYCDYHIQSGAPVQKLSPDELGNKFGFKYIPDTGDSLADGWKSCADIESPHNMFKYYRASIATVLQERYQAVGAFCEHYKILPKPEKFLVVHQTHPSVGYGLATIKKIPKCTVILEYTGEVTDADIIRDNTYTLNNGFADSTLKPLLDRIHVATNAQEEALSKTKYAHATYAGIDSDIVKPYKGTLGTKVDTRIDAKYEGGLARFVSHMPLVFFSENGMEMSKVYGGYNVLRANLYISCHPSTIGHARCFFITTRDIEPKTDLGFDYTPTYRFGAAPRYFDEATGLVINEDGAGLYDPQVHYENMKSMGDSSHPHIAEHQDL